MNKFGTYYKNQTCTSKLVRSNDKDTLAVLGILETLSKGYRKRDIDNVDAYVKDLFLGDDSVYILGTASDELCPGLDEVKDLLESDWEYWGDAAFELDHALINVEGDLAWFGTPGTVKYSFEHTSERYDNYVEFAKTKANDQSVSAEKRVALINWAMALTYHQQELEKRDYLCPMRLSGVMIKKDGAWKIAQSQFSMAKGIFPDQRLEEHQEFIDEEKADIEAFKGYKSEEVSPEIKDFIHKFSRECIGHETVDLELVNRYFSSSSRPYIISPDTEWYVGNEAISEFFGYCSDSDLTLDTEVAVTRNLGDRTWVTGIGRVRQTISANQVADRALEALNTICDSDETSQKKLYDLHRQVAYAMKEISVGDSYTYPIRYSVMISDQEGHLSFEQMHLSYPYYWIFEGKLDSV